MKILNPKNIFNQQKFSGVSSVYKYKGLENDIIILTDITSLNSRHDKAQLYTGMSRAKYQLYMLIDESIIEEYDKILNSLEECK